MTHGKEGFDLIYIIVLRLLRYTNYYLRLSVQLWFYVLNSSL